MSYTTLMVHLELGNHNKALLKLTGELSERLNAGVIGIAACQPMRVIYNDGHIPDTIIERDRNEIDDELKATEAEFRATLTGRAAFVDWRCAVTHRSLSTYLANEACCADLLITGVDRNASLFDMSRHVDTGDLVMQAGRPCLIVPVTADRLALDHVVVGWKDTRETRRAICDALPVLRAAGQVTVVTIAAKEDLPAAALRLQDVIGWLKRHGIAATPIISPSDGDDAAALNGMLQAQKAGLLVAGAYGHSRVREWALGGVTRDLLLRAKHCTLVSH